MTRPQRLPQAWFASLGGAGLALALLLPGTLWAHPTAAPSQRATLDNGLRIVAQGATGSGLAAVCINYRAGSRHEAPGQRGLARMVESLMTQGSRNLGPGDALRLISERGGIAESATTSDVSQFCSELPVSNLSLALWVEADRMKNLSATPQAFAVQRNLLLMQLTTRASSEQHSQGLQRLTQLAYQDYSPYQGGALGGSNDLQSLTLQDARDFHWRYYTPSNAVVSVVADLDPSQSIELVSKYFASAPNRDTAPAPLELRAEPRQSSERLSVQSDDNCVAPGVYHGFRVARAGSDEHRIAQVIATILGGSDAARLPQSLIGERGSALQTKVWLWGNDAADLLAIYAAVAPLSSVDKVQEVVDAELKRLRFFGPSLQEVEAAKAAVRQDLLQRSESPMQVARWQGQREALGSTFDMAAELEALQAITPDQIRVVAQQYLPEHKRSTVELYPPGWPQDEAPLVVLLKHSVKRGENLEGIARRYGSSVSEIARASGIDAKRAIQPGQTLKVPVVGGKVPAAPAPMRSHKVRSGDSLSVVAKIYGTTVAEIVRLNGLDRNKPIMIGQKLIIPPKQTKTEQGATPSKPKTAPSPAAKSGARAKSLPAPTTKKSSPATTTKKKKK
jgi:predicted Zn-dependent peptidase/LysM repeat protein